MKKEIKKPFHEQVAENLIKQLEAGTAPWQIPWKAGQPNAMMPINATSGKRYRGINAINLMAQGREDSRWLTYNQASGMGAQVKKGEKGTTVQYWKFSEEQDKLDAKGKPELDENGKKKKITVKLERPRVFYATVFNGEQVDGMPPVAIKKVEEQSWNAIERAEHILAASGAKIKHENGDRAFYRPSTDSITLPERTQFESADAYYATALHELGHWTGHPTRLDRDLSNPFGSDGYAKEELRAEISSMILGDELGIGHDPSQHVSYVASWIKNLKDDPMEIFRAAADAEKINDFVLSFEQQLVQEQEQNQVIVEKNELPEGWKEVVADGMVINDNPQTGGIVDKNEKLDRWFYVSHQEGISASEPIFTSKEDAIHALMDATQNIAPAQQSMSAPAIESERQYINVPFKEKGEAKDLGARWDRAEKSWYVPAGVDAKQFEKWNKPAEQVQNAEKAIQTTQDSQQAAEVGAGRKYLAVPYEERGAAKEAGARWDKAAKSWYAGENADLEKLAKWEIGTVEALGEQSPAMTPQEEFGSFLRSLDFIIEDGHPIMDGKSRRVSVEGDKQGEKSGFYVGHSDGHPAGYMKNNRTGEEERWKSKGYTLNPEARAEMQAVAAQKLADRAQALEETQLATAAKLEKQAEGLSPVLETTTYLKAKGVQAHKGVLTDAEGKRTFIPATDANGKQWTTQYIQEDGTKRFAKDSRKEGCFHAVGGLEAVAAAPVLVIAEGYATAASVAEALGHATVAAFDSGNLTAVAKALSEKFPDKPIVIAGDDDAALALTHGVNSGRVKALEAAEAVGGKAIFPTFATGENTYPADLPPVTPELYKAHTRATRQLEAAAENKVQISETEKARLETELLSGAQLAAIAGMKKHTDFNDLAEKSELGKKGLVRQVTAASKQVISEQAKAIEKTKKRVAEKGNKQDEVEKPKKRAAKI
jgi:putative DNA primase/helicase